MANRINFTPEHEARLKQLAIIMLFDGITLKGTVGTELTVQDLLHNTTVNTLVMLNSNLKKEIERISGLDEWSMNDYQQRKLANTKELQEFTNLLIGYKKFQAEKQSAKAEIANLKAQYAEIKKSTMTPQDQLTALEKKIKELGDDEDVDSSTTQV